MTQLLTRVLTRLGPYRPPSPEQVESLAVGDREALLLHLRRAAFGDRMDCIVTCQTCQLRMEVTLSVSALLLPAYTAEMQWHPVRVGGVDLMLRAPTGADQVAVADVAAFDVEEAARALLDRCLREVPPTWPPTPEQEQHLQVRIAEIDPQADVMLQFHCPECSAYGEAALDTADYLFREWSRRQHSLLAEVHHLALHYHWSEADILGMPAARRRIYLQMLGVGGDTEEVRR